MFKEPSKVNKTPLIFHEYRLETVLEDWIVLILGLFQVNKPTNKELWVVFGGVGANWQGMGLNLLKYKVFKDSVEESLGYTKKIVSYVELVKREHDLNTMFMSLLVLQLGLVDILKFLNIHPAGIIGHSFGEIVACYYAGNLTKKECVDLAEKRAESAVMSTPGLMLAVKMSYRDVPCDVEIGCVNSSNSCVLSGTTQKIDGIEKQFKKEGVKTARVQSCGKAFHSKLMKTSAAHYKALMSDLKPREPAKHLHSSSASYGTTIDAWYFANNMLSQVQFHQTASVIPENSFVLEVSPHPMLCSGLQRDVRCNCVPMMSRNVDDQMCVALKDISNSMGVSIDFSTLEEIGEEWKDKYREPLVNAGGLIKWDYSKSWFVPKQEHFPTIGVEKETTINKDITAWAANREKDDDPVKGETSLSDKVRDVIGLRRISNKGLILQRMGLDSLMTTELIELLQGNTGNEYSESEVLMMSFDNIELIEQRM